MNLTVFCSCGGFELGVCWVSVVGELCSVSCLHIMFEFEGECCVTAAVGSVCFDRTYEARCLFGTVG